MKLVLKILLISLIASNVFAEDAVVLDKGQPAPSTGIFLPIDKAQQYRRDILDLDYNKALVISLTKTSNELETKVQKKDDQLNLYIQQNDKLAQTSYKLQQTNEYERIGIFALGILTMYGVYHLK